MTFTVHNVSHVNESLSIRETTFEGRPQIVVPAIILVEGVHNDLYYPASEIAASVQAWNGVPVTIAHPRDVDAYGSANHPSVLEESCVGRVFNTTLDPDGAKVRCELWLDVEKLEKVSPETVALIRAGHRLEVSTGLFADDVGGPGTWRNERYVTTARHFRPDHLALLPNELGACSWQDGCGVRSNTDKREGSMTKKMTAGVGQNFACSALANADGTLTIGDYAYAPVISPGFGSTTDWTQILGPITNANCGCHDATPISALKKLKSFGFAFKINAEISHDSLRSKLQKVCDSYDSDQWVHFVTEVFDNHFIYEGRGMNPGSGGYAMHLYKRDYTLGDNGEVKVSDSVVEVIEVTEYVPVADAVNANKTKEEGKRMNKDKVNALIANDRTAFCENDRAWLETLADDKLDLLVPITPTPAPVPVVNTPTPPKTVEEFIGSAPDAFKSLLSNALARENAAKKALVDGLLANARNEFKAEELNAMGTSELERLAKLADVPANFEGRSGGASTTNNADNDIPVLKAPEMLSRKKAA